MCGRRYGQLFNAAYDDEENEKDFASWIMERLPGAQTGGTEPFRPLFKVSGIKIEAIMDLTPDISLFSTDDEGHGSPLYVIHRHSGYAWSTKVRGGRARTALHAGAARGLTAADVPRHVLRLLPWSRAGLDAPVRRPAAPPASRPWTLTSCWARHRRCAVGLYMTWQQLRWRAPNTSETGCGGWDHGSHLLYMCGCPQDEWSDDEGDA
jgi:hypothetical protein